jgi:hypothetical protein
MTRQVLFVVLKSEEVPIIGVLKPFICLKTGHTILLIPTINHRQGTIA